MPLSGLLKGNIYRADLGLFHSFAPDSLWLLSSLQSYPPLHSGRSTKRTYTPHTAVPPASLPLGFPLSLWSSSMTPLPFRALNILFFPLVAWPWLPHSSFQMSLRARQVYIIDRMLSFSIVPSLLFLLYCFLWGLAQPDSCVYIINTALTISSPSVITPWMQGLIFNFNFQRFFYLLH